MERAPPRRPGEYRPDQPAEAESGHIEKTLKVHEQKETKNDGEWDFLLKTNVLFTSLRNVHRLAIYRDTRGRSAAMTVNDCNQLRILVCNIFTSFQKIMDENACRVILLRCTIFHVRSKVL